MLVLGYLLFSLKDDALKHIPYSGEGSKKRRLKQYKFHAKRLYSEGYRNCYAAAPEDVLSPHAPFEEFVEASITEINVTSQALIHSVKQDLTPSLGKATPELSVVAREAVLSELPSCPDWSEVDIHHALVRIVTIVSGWMFVGPEYCRTEEYMDLAANYAADAFGGPKLLQIFPKRSRAFVAPLLPPLRRVWKAHRRITTLLGPAIQARRDAALAGHEVPDDMLQWIIKNAHRFPAEIKADGDIARLQLSLSAVAIHTTALTATATLYDLAAEPEILSDVRREISDVLRKHDGKITSKTLFDMKLLDAVCKESQRLNPADLLSARRRVMKPFKFSDGVSVPPGTMLAVPVHHIGRDRNLFPDNPDKFDPYRFTKLRQNDGEGNHFQFASVTNGTMAFGWGKHACPGRFFASSEIKLILIHLLSFYDIEVTAGPDGLKKRYSNFELGNMNMPDVTRKLLFRKIAD
ncbi:ent-kaurene oxidase [Colletotrichum truncatum]|uniref:Ent-kaurene oxidase n=1 Tax=Colletotrichum truncatum TaxID=5467 RepID=A0ACC3Z2W0_COLTU